MKIWIWWYVIWLLRLLHCSVERDKMIKTEKIFKVVMLSPTAHALGQTGNFVPCILILRTIDYWISHSRFLWTWKHSSSRYFKRGQVMTNIKPINGQENGHTCGLVVIRSVCCERQIPRYSSAPHHRYKLFALNRTKYVWTRQLPFTSYREAGSVPSKNEGSLVTSVLRECDESFMRIDDGLSESSNLTWNKEVCPAKKKQKQNCLYNLFTCL